MVVANASSGPPLRNAAITSRSAALDFCPESAYQINNKTDCQNQANTTAADDRTPKIKSATAEQEKKDEQNE